MLTKVLHQTKSQKKFCLKEPKPDIELSREKLIEISTDDLLKLFGLKD